MHKPYAVTWFDKRNKQASSLVFSTPVRALAFANLLEIHSYNIDVKAFDIRTQKGIGDWAETEPVSGSERNVSNPAACDLHLIVSCAVCMPMPACTSENPDYPGLTCHYTGTHPVHYALGYTWQ